MSGAEWITNTTVQTVMNEAKIFFSFTEFVTNLTQQFLASFSSDQASIKHEWDYTYTSKCSYFF